MSRPFFVTNKQIKKLNSQKLAKQKQKETKIPQNNAAGNRSIYLFIVLVFSMFFFV